MSVNLRVVGVFFKKDIVVAITPATTIKDVMDAAQRQFPGFSYSTATGSQTLYEVKNKVEGAPKSYVLRDSDRKRKPVQAGQALQTWQSYIIRQGKNIGLDGVFVPFSSRIVEDGDEIVWRLVTVAKRFPL